MFQRLKGIIRISDWWQHIIPPVLFFYFLGLIQNPYISFDYKQFSVFIIFLFAVATFGFFIGEWSDIEDDKRAGKENKVESLSTFLRLIILFSISIIIGLSFIYLDLNIFQKWLIYAQLICFGLYSLKPFRLKKNPWISLVLDALYSGTFMYMFAFLFFHYTSDNLLIIIGIIGILRGSRNYLIHTLKDAENDKKIGIASLGILLEETNLIKSLLTSLLFESIALIILISQLPQNQIYLFGALFLSLITYLVYINKNKFSKIDISISFNLLYEVFLPIMALCLLIYLQAVTFLILIFLIILFPSWWSWIRKGFFIPVVVFIFASWFFNHFETDQKINNHQPILNKLNITVSNTTKLNGTFSHLEKSDSLEIDKTVVFVIDVWDKHWCKEVNEKQGILAEKINEELVHLRAKGITIIHIPSDCINFYEKYPQRQKIKKRKTKIDSSRLIFHGKEINIFKHDILFFKTLHDEGCNCEPKCTNQPVWTRQHPNISIEAEDIISTDPMEIYTFLQNNNIKNIIYMGMHANICLLKRPIGIIKMKTLGFNCFVHKEFTDVMFDNELIENMTQEETKEKIYDLIEYHFCSSIID